LQQQFIIPSTIDQPAKHIAPASGNFHPVTVKPIWQSDFAVAHAQILSRSFKHFTQRDLVPGNLPAAELSRFLFEAPFALLSHGTQADPVLNYGNQTALALWEMGWDEFTRMPSRLTAEAPNREERARILAAVAMRGFAGDYSGVRISKSGRRFEIARATIWNLRAEDGNFHGQAAMFDRWELI
jgi:hypothetical protein